MGFARHSRRDGSGAEEVEGGTPWGLRDCGAAGPQGWGSGRPGHAGWQGGGARSEGRFALIFSFRKDNLKGSVGVDRQVESAGGRRGRRCRQRAVLEGRRPVNGAAALLSMQRCSVLMRDRPRAETDLGRRPTSGRDQPRRQKAPGLADQLTRFKQCVRSAP